MKCPVDNEILTISDRQGIEIDYCPKCRGVWLDRGELDKIIERSEVSPPFRKDQRDEDDNDNRGYDRDQSDYSKGYSNYDNNKKRRDSFLGDLFDF